MYFDHMLIYFRVDSGVDIGMGHLVRCLSLASCFEDHGHHVEFICMEHLGNQISKVEDLFTVHRLKKYDDKKLILESNPDIYNSKLRSYQKLRKKETFMYFLQNAKKCDLLVIDHYGVDYNLEMLWSQFVGKIMVIDDGTRKNHYCNYIVDSCDTHYYNNPYSTKLVGRKYFILNEEYLKVPIDIRSTPKPFNRVHISFGGSDKTNQTSKFIDFLIKNKKEIKNFDQIHFDIIVGGSNPNYDSIVDQLARYNLSNLKLHHNISSKEMVELLKTTNLAIGCTGISVFERLFMGVPTIVKNIAQNQDTNLKFLSNKDLIYVPENDMNILEFINWYSTNEYIQEKMITKCSEFIDGLGCQRIVEYVSKW